MDDVRQLSCDITHAGFHRIERDAYFTLDPRPVPALWMALGSRRRSVLKTCLEPMCGAGHLSEDLKEYRQNVVANDIHNYGYPGQTMAKDILDLHTMPEGIDWVCMNPPYKTALIDKMLQHILKIARPGMLVAALVPHRYDAAGSRAKFLKRSGLLLRINLPFRIWWFKPHIPLAEGEYTPAKDHIWLVFKVGYTGPDKNIYLEPEAFKWFDRSMVREPDCYIPSNITKNPTALFFAQNKHIV